MANHFFSKSIGVLLLMGIYQKYNISQELNNDVEKMRDVKSLRNLVKVFDKKDLENFIVSCAMQDDNMYDELLAIANENINCCKLFVRGLAWETTTESILAVFSEFGSIKEGSVAMDKQKQTSKGYGFITYEDAASAARALENPRKRIDGRWTTCNLAALRNEIEPSNDPLQAFKKVFIHSLDYSTTEDTLRAVYESFGPIEECTIIFDRNTNKSKGYAFVTYLEPHHAALAVAQPEKRIDGRSTYCNLAIENVKPTFVPPVVPPHAMPFLPYPPMKRARPNAYFPYS